MMMAVAATCEHNRLKWLRVVQVWQDLARVNSERRWLNDHALVPIRIGLPDTIPSPRPKRLQPGVAASVIAQDN
jgi:hypothetical protein